MGKKETVRGSKLDNRWVVPYNPYLLRLFNCHINVEACDSIKAVKYLFKYIYKGHDRASVVVRDANKADGDIDEIKQYRDARNMLQSMGKDIKNYPLPDIIDIYDDTNSTDREIYEEESIEPTAKDVALKETLNKEQRAAYDKIIATVDTDLGRVFFVDGPGGTSKTYLYKALLAVLRSQDKIVVATATSGVAASIMPGGRTAHSRFKIPLTIDDGAVCSFTKQSGTARLIQKASLLIWDEVSMTKRQAVEALDNNLRDIMDRPRLPFGGKTVMFGGDFRQVLPVVRMRLRCQSVISYVI
ncbi:hypothetical protein U9M48_016306 [Paspalum notatum var. saurae]|uniref:ATP-dependent DNA helicase n=1 Tax=Paspalum notatum var. saurae TaxID=547442 RepID=A0AAQ3WN00_PASNO